VAAATGATLGKLILHLWNISKRICEKIHIIQIQVNSDTEYKTYTRTPRRSKGYKSNDRKTPPRAFIEFDKSLGIMLFEYTSIEKYI
jgi:hypothetical protein